jgi:hypothetical protein
MFSLDARQVQRLIDIETETNMGHATRKSMNPEVAPTHEIPKQVNFD